MENNIIVRKLSTTQQYNQAIKICTDSFFMLNKIWMHLSLPYEKIYDIVMKEVQLGVQFGLCYGTFLNQVMISSMIFVELFTYLDKLQGDQETGKSKIYNFQKKYRKLLFQPFLKSHSKNDCVILTFSGILPEFSNKRYAAWSWVYGFKLMQEMGYKYVYAEVYNQNLWQIQNFYRRFGQVANQKDIEQQFAKGDKYVLWRADLSRKIELPTLQQFKSRTPKSKL